VRALEDLAVLLGAELGQPVRRLGGDRVRLGRRHLLRLAVDRPARRGVHDAPDARVARRLEHVDRAQHVDRGVDRRVGDRLAHVDLRGEMEDDPRLRLGDHVAQRAGVADVGLHEPHPALDRAREVVAPARREVVDHGDLVAALHERVHQVRADEARPACHDRAHEGGDPSGRLTGCYRRPHGRPVRDLRGS
jgi:hypothetical protein